MCHRRGFGQAVAFDEASLRQLLKRFLHLHRQRRRPADAGFDRLDAIITRAAEIVDRHVHGWDAGENRRLVTLDGLENVQNLELRF